jgi:hypothetical protein
MTHNPPPRKRAERRGKVPFGVRQFIAAFRWGGDNLPKSVAGNSQYPSAESGDVAVPRRFLRQISADCGTIK